MSKSKKILIVTYYWPPSGGSGVQRWLKFSKYLLKMGWEPIVVAPDQAAYPDRDEYLLNEIPAELRVIKEKIIEPYQLLNKLSKSSAGSTGAVTKEKVGLKSKITTWVRGNLFFPDPRIYWVKPTINRLKKLITEEGIDYIITTGPPHSVHLIGLGLKSRFPKIKWLADFRDPWTDIHYFKDFGFSTNVVNRHKLLEKKVISSADVILSASPKMEEGLKEKGAQRVATITNGFDPEDFKEVPSSSNSFVISHVGVLFDKRNSVHLWQAIAELKLEDERFNEQLEIRMAGEIGPEVKASIEKHGLKDQTQFLGYLDQRKAAQEQQEAGLSLVMLAASETTIVPGKIVELFGAQKPILAVAPLSSPVYDLLEETHYGCAVQDDARSIAAMKTFIKAVFNGEWSVDYDKAVAYSRPSMTENLISVLESISE